MKLEVTFTRLLLIVLLSASSVTPAWADQVDMQNGDRYCGRILSVSPNLVVVQNDVLGRLQLPRSKVAAIRFASPPGAATAQAAQPVPAPQVAPTAPAQPQASIPPLPDLSKLAGQGAATPSIDQIREQLLGAAGPAAAAKYSQMVSGLLSGQINLDDLRVQAKDAADQLRELKRGLGNDVGDSLDSYLSILDNFLAQTKTEAPGNLSTNAPAPQKPAKPGPASARE